MLYYYVWLYLLLLVIYPIQRLQVEAYLSITTQQRTFVSFPSRHSYASSTYKLVDRRTGNTFIRPSSKFQKHTTKLAAIHLPSATSLITAWSALLKAIYPADLLLFLVFELSYKRFLRFAHSAQSFVWKALSFGTPYEWQKSMLGFVEERCDLFGKLIGLNYVIKLVCLLLTQIGFRIRPDLPDLLSRISYTLYCAQFFDLFKGQFLHSFFPYLADNRRQSYVVNRSSSVIIWFLCGLIALEMVSTFLKVPLSSILAFGGIGGLAIGLSARDIVSNFLGGMMILFNEPFTPGDMVCFRMGNVDVMGRVERIGWGQTRIRGKDTRPTYIPNSHFVQTAVTNMERITHRKYENTIPLRFQVSSCADFILLLNSSLYLCFSCLPGSRSASSCNRQN
jgi:hypothetical protein